MIEIIVVVSILLITIIGTIFFFKKFFNIKKEIRDTRLTLIALEACDNPEALDDKYFKSKTSIIFNWIDDNIGFGKIITWSFVFGLIYVLFNMISSNPVQVQTVAVPPPVNINNTNMTWGGMILNVFPQGTPMWMIIVIMLIPGWILWRIFVRGTHSYGPL
jgi:hypothetical protein